MRVLFVDDDLGTLKLYSQSVTNDYDVEVDCCLTAIEGLKRLSSGVYDYAFVDWKLNVDQTGDVLIFATRDFNIKTKFYILTAWDRDTILDKVAVIRAYITDVVDKRDMDKTFSTLFSDFSRSANVG